MLGLFGVRKNMRSAAHFGILQLLAFVSVYSALHPSLETVD